MKMSSKKNLDEMMNVIVNTEGVEMTEDVQETVRDNLRDYLKKVEPKKPKKIKDPNRPKGAKSAYLFFCDDFRATVRDELGDAPMTAVSKELGRRWQATKNRAKWEAAAEEDKRRYAQEMDAYVPPTQDELVAQKKKGPKRALSAYMFYAKAVRATVKAEHPDATFGEIGRLLGDQWRSLSDDEKEPYVALNLTDKERYTQELAAMNDTQPAAAAAAVAAPSTPKASKPKKAPGAPKKPAKKGRARKTAGQKLFEEEEREVLEEEFPDLNKTKINALLKQRWNDMPAEDQADYEDQAVE